MLKLGRTPLLANRFLCHQSRAIYSSVQDSSAECVFERLEGEDQGIALITFNRPHARNALGKTFMDQFRRGLAHLRFDDSVRVVVLRSNVDRVFCAGADLKERATMNPNEVSAFVYGLRAAFSEVETLPVPTIAAIDGAALGGGLEVALAADIRVAGAGARIGLPETKLAIIPGAGGTQRLPRLIGASRAKELIFTGRVLDAKAAFNLGLVNHAVEGVAYEKALEIAREILPAGPIATRMAKQAIDKGVQVDVASGMAIEQGCYAQIIPTEDRLEGLRAFREKRTPIYKGPVRNGLSKTQYASSMAGTLINITLALVGNYCDFDYIQVNGSLVTNFKVSAEQTAIVSELYSSWTYFSDVAIQAAVGIVNDDPSILPGIHVTLKRFTDCGGWYPSVLDTYSGTSGGFATAIMANEIVEEHPDVVGVIGNQYSTTTIGPAEVLSLAQIPYCSGSAGTPRLSNRANYPYFWRTMTSLGAGEQMAALLKTWNVGRVAIIYQTDDNFGSESAKDILGSMRQNQIRVLENIGVKKSGLENATIDYVSTLLHRVDARYFILSGQEDFQSTAYETLAEHGLVGPKYVWMSLLPINLKNQTLQQGFVLMQQRIPDSTTFLYREFLRRYTDISQMNVTMNEFDLGSYIAPLFDCTSMMLRGFEKLLKSIPGSDGALKLASRKLQSQMSFELFKGLGSDGLTEQPIDINLYGDLAAPFEVLFFNDGRALAAGQMSVDGKFFSPYPSGQLLFFGGSSTPPPDGAPPITHHSLTSQAKAFVCSLFISGVIVCFLSAAFISSFRKHFEIKSMEVDYALIIHVGAFIGNSCIAIELLPDSITKCHLRTWLFILYIATTVSPMLVKNLYVWYIFTAMEELNIRRLSFKFHSLNIAIIVFDVLLLALWSLTTRFQNELVSISTTRLMYTCVIPDQSFSSSVVLGVFNAILVLTFIPVLYITRHVRPPWSDSTTMTLSFILLSFLWTVVSTLQLAVEEMNDLRRCLCIWVIVMGILAIITVPRAYNVWYERKSRIAAHILLHQTMDKVIASVTTPWKEKPGVQSPLMGRKTSQAWLPVESLQPLHYSQFQLPGTHSVRIKKLFWGSWMLSVVSFHILKDRAWISFATQHKTSCVVISECQTNVSVCESLVAVEFGRNEFMAGLFGYRVVIEFDQLADALTFQTEFKKHLARCPF
ncbi:hypothetical protein HDU77_003796 [Chytriomyces hyalinus]|nr:hypothetical protein HDU77_003796 [Chytriomyces hyalinus]